MFLQKLNLTPFFDKPGDSGTALEIPPKDIGKEDIIELLKDDEDDEKLDIKEPKKEAKEKEDKEAKEDKEDKEDKEGKEDKEAEDELKLLEEDLEEPTDEQLELASPVPRREILKKYPNLFKDFPYLEKAYYRERELTQIFPEIQDAKDALEAKETLERFDEDLKSGNTKPVLQAVKEGNPRAFNRLVDNYLTVLSEIDNKAYYHVIGNVIKHTVLAMYEEGKDQENEELQAAAAALNKFMFATTKFKPPTQLSTEDDKEDSREVEIQRREREVLENRFNGARDEMNTRVNNVIKNTISANIDPKNSMTEYIKRSAINDAVNSIEELIAKDSRFKLLVDKLWERAFKDDFSKKSLDNIRSAFNSKALMLLPSVIKKARVEALRGMGKRVKPEEEEEEQDSAPDKKSPLPPGRPQSHIRGKITKPEDIPKGMRSIDFLNLD